MPRVHLPNASLGGPLPPGASMDPSQTKALSSRRPQQVPLFLLFQPNFGCRDSGCSLPTPGFIWAHCRRLQISLLRPFHSWEDEAQRNLRLLACSRDRLLGALSHKAQLLRTESRSWPGTWRSWEETSSELSPWAAPRRVRPLSLSPPVSLEMGRRLLGIKRTGRKQLQPSDPVLWRSRESLGVPVGVSG